MIALYPSEKPQCVWTREREREKEQKREREKWFFVCVLSEPAYANGDLEFLIVYSSYAHRNDIDLFLSEQPKLEKWSKLTELRVGLY